MTTVAASEGLSIGRVVQRLFAALEANIVPFLTLSLVLAAGPVFLSGSLRSSGMNPLMIALLGLLVLLLQIFGSILLQASLIIGSVSYFDGERTGPGDWISRGLSRWWRLLGVDLLAGLASGAAALLFVIPGIIVAIRYSVAAPAALCEDQGVTAALARSAALTKDRRWAIFGLGLLFFIPIVILELTLIGFAAGSPANFVAGMQSPAVRMVVLPLLNLLVPLISAPGVAALYVELRAGREVAGAAHLAQVFE